MKRLKALSLVALSAVLLVSLVPRPAQAAVVTPHLLFDSFKTLKLHPAPTAFWYVTHNGDENGSPMMWWDQNCGDASCAYAVKEKGVTMVRMQLTPDETPGFYTGVDVSEMQTGFSANVPGKWLPKYKHPVVLNARVKWSSNFKQDGTGGAIGSSGIWFWNSPIDVPNQAYNPQDGLGFHWIQEGSITSGGIGASMIDDSWPVLDVTPQRTVNLQKWVNLTMVWSTDKSGNQSVQYWINGEDLGKHNIEFALGAMSLTMWHDNQKPTWEGVEFPNPTAPQNFDVDYVSVTQP